MNNILFKLFLTVGLVILIQGCSKGDENETLTSTEPPLANQSLTYIPDEALKNKASYPIGNVVSAYKLHNNSSFTNTLINDFNSITAENDMKMANIFKGPDNYDFSDGDAIIDFAKQNGFRVFGHALIWHNAIPQWLASFSGTDQEFEHLIKNYIQATVSHFAAETISIDGKQTPVVAGWDVVNEAFTNQAEQAIFRQRLGPDYVAKCFQWAREADDQVLLFYNDYNMEYNANKTQQVVSMIHDFNQRNIAIDGVGFQMHIDYLSLSTSTLQAHVNAFVSLGVLIHFSEVDMTVNRDKGLTSLTYDRASEQELKFKEIAQVYATIPSEQQFGITFWGMRDNDSWLRNFYDNPYEYPLLFNDNYEPKIAHRGFAEGLID